MTTETLTIIPEAEAANDEAERSIAWARAFTIASGEDLQAAGRERARIKARRDEIEELRTTLKRPILAAAKNVDDQFRGPLAELDRAITIINGAVKQYQAALAEAEAERRREAMAEEERLRKLAAKHEASGNIAKADAFEQRADAVYQPAAPLPDMKAGIAMRERWNFEITDATLLPREYLMPNEKAIGKVVSGLKGLTRIPGVRVYRDDIVAGSGR